MNGVPIWRNHSLLITGAGVFLSLAVVLLFSLVFRSEIIARNDFARSAYYGYIDNLHKNNLTNIARYITKMFPALSDPERLQREAGTEWFQSESERLRYLKDFFNLARIYYVAKGGEGGYTLLMSAAVQRDLLPEPLAQPAWSEPYPGFVDAAWESGDIVFSKEPAATISAGYPVVADGAVVGILGLDYDISFLKEVYDRHRIVNDNENILHGKILAAYAVFCAVMFAIMFLQARFVRRSALASAYQADMDEKNRAMLHAMPIAYILMDTAGTLIECNSKALQVFGFETEEECLSGFLALAPERQPDGTESGAKVKAMFAATLEKGCATFSWEHRHADRSPLPIEVTLVLVMLKGKPYFLNFIRDLREEVVARARIEMANRELRKALDLAKEREDAKIIFMARISHELRTPINAILGMAELMLYKKPPPELMDYIAAINQSGHGLLAIINDILDYSKLEVGQVAVKRETYSVASLLHDVINVIRMRLIGKDIAFVVKVDPDIPAYLTGDVLRIRQILINLLGNAVNYTRSGHISLNARHEMLDGNAAKLVFRVLDTGIGIRKENLRRLFTSFTRLKTAENMQPEGSGLGLSISRTLCQALGGEISVESEFGRGSVFTFSLTQGFENYRKLAEVEDPGTKQALYMEKNLIRAESLRYSFSSLGVGHRHVTSVEDLWTEIGKNACTHIFVPKEHVTECARILAAVGSGAQIVGLVDIGDIAKYGYGVKSMIRPVSCVDVANILNGTSDEKRILTDTAECSLTAYSVKVLVVDDVGSNLRVSQELLRLYGIEADVAKNSREAMSLVRMKRYDLVFMDHMMQDMDGIETTRKIRALGADDPYFADLPIIALTANVMAGSKESFLAAGMNGYLPKPIEMQKLTRVLEKWLPREKLTGTRPAAPSSREAEEVPEIPGISAQAGLRNVGGNAAVYLEVIDLFCDTAEKNADHMELAVGNGDALRYARAAHALKGAARNIGALELAERADHMENAAKAGDMPALRGGTEGFIFEIRRLAAAIRGNLSRSAAPDGADADGACEIRDFRLEALRQALAAYDIAAINEITSSYAAAVRGGNGVVPAEVREIERCILLFEYEKAIEKIDAVLGREAGSDRAGGAVAAPSPTADEGS